MVEIRQTETFAAWFRRLKDIRAKARIAVRIRRLSLDNPGDAKPVGNGVSGDKSTQTADIREAKKLAADLET